MVAWLASLLFRGDLASLLSTPPTAAAAAVKVKY